MYMVYVFKMLAEIILVDYLILNIICILRHHTGIPTLTGW